ncbi:MAG: peptidylprolyl isomerase [Alteromonadaceae bacterium]|nr:peptidylprolyl isomerase [Alteromonadaceae bacterium]MBH86538.1 peptidylprolyl isomerase [Alteromonadaceae bacterium]
MVFDSGRARAIFRVGLIFLLALFAFACSQVPTYERPHSLVAANQTYDFQTDIKPIFEAKCMACHGCYDAPCQLKLTSSEGLLRGASPLPVYAGSRLEDMAPTRLGIDAVTTSDWRDKGFFSVLHGDKEGALDARETSVLFQMIALGRENPLPPNSRLPEDLRTDIGRPQSCPTLADLEDYAEDNPHGGMPFATTGLTDEEYARIQTWVAEGALTQPQPYDPGDAELAQVARWETFFNQSGAREALVARYLYEHLFTAHLYFDTLEGSRFYQIVRSWTAPGQPILPVATVRPNEDPEGRFYYRLQPVNSTIVEKTHITYALNDDRMARYRSLFLDSDWSIGELPGYGYKDRSNPFATFDAIPAKARYRFMLDTAQYFVRTFIRGPVCRGQIATDVIRDQFWTVFEDPDHDAFVNDKAYREQVTPLLGLPGVKSDIMALGSEWFDYKAKRNEYLADRQLHYNARDPQGAAMSDIWDGDGTNTDALLTIFRHHDSASVRNGLLGRVPRTIWVMDYPLLERTYYELVVNFNVFGSVSHQAQTRLYFDLIRNGSEHNFLRFVPADQRQALYDHWYQDSGKIKDAITYTDLDVATPVDIDYGPQRGNTAVMDKFSQLLLDRAAAVAGPPDFLNRCFGGPCERPNASPLQKDADAILRGLAFDNGATMPAIKFLPEVVFLRVSSEDERWVYTLVHNRIHSNVAFMFGEDSRLLPEQDTVSVIDGTLGSYPNFSFDVPLNELDAFVSAFKGITRASDMNALAERWGVRRTSPDFWDVMADFRAFVEQTNPVEAGIFDVNRYENL